jgi:ornithine carbamoyltransferase
MAAFAVGIKELGGDVVELDLTEILEEPGDGLGESPQGRGMTLSLLVISSDEHQVVKALAERSAVPVLNAHTDLVHPCQVLSDLYTLHRRGKDLDEITVAWIGGASSVLQTWIEATNLFGFNLRFAVPDGLEPDAEMYLAATALSRGDVARMRNPYEAALGADIIYTDKWTGTDQGAHGEWRRAVFAGFQVNEVLMEAASPEAVFMHGRPANRGEEVADSVLDGPQSIVEDQAANLMHLQKALMVDLVSHAGHMEPRRA